MTDALGKLYSELFKGPVYIFLEQHMRARVKLHFRSFSTVREWEIIQFPSTN